MKRDGLLDLNEALQHPGRKIEVDLTSDLEEEPDIDLVEPLSGYLEAVSTGNMLLIHGEFETKCMCECARCGSPIEQAVKFEMDEEFQVEGTPSMYAQDDFAKVVNDETYEIFEENSLHVERLIAQGLILNLPVQPLCAYGWEGPCPNAIAAEELAKSTSPHLEASVIEMKGKKSLDKLTKLTEESGA